MSAGIQTLLLLLFLLSALTVSPLMGSPHSASVLDTPPTDFICLIVVLSYYLVVNIRGNRLE